MAARNFFYKQKLFRGLVPLHHSPLAAALVRQNDGAGGREELFRSYVRRSAFFDHVSHVGIKPAIVAALGLYFASLAVHQAKRSPVFFRFETPILAPVKAVGAVGSAQGCFLRIHAILDERSSSSVDEQVRTGSVGEDASFQRDSRPGIFQRNIEGVVDERGLALTDCGGRNGSRLAEKHDSLIDQVRPQIPQNASGGKVGSFAPGIRLRFRPEAVVARLVFGDVAKHSRVHKLSYRMGNAIVTAILIDGEQTAAFLDRKSVV